MNENPLEVLERAMQGGTLDEADQAMLTAVVIIMLAIAAVALVAALINYVLYSWGLFRIAKKLYVPNAFLAWIPYAQYYTLGQVAERCDERNGCVFPRPWGKIVLIGSLATAGVYAVLYGINLVSAYMPAIGVIISLLVTLVMMLVALVPLVLDSICRWKIYREFYPETVNVVLLIVSIALNAQAIVTLIASFREPKLSAD